LGASVGQSRATTTAQLTSVQGIPSTQLPTTAQPPQALLGPAGATTIDATSTSIPPVTTTPVPAQQEQEQQRQPAGQATAAGPQPTPEAELDFNQKMKMLDERLIRGEIDQDIYLNLKARLEIDEKPFAPAPQLPPATAPASNIPITTITTPTPTTLTTPTTAPETVPEPSLQPDMTQPPESIEPLHESQPSPEMGPEQLPVDLPGDAYVHVQEQFPSQPSHTQLPQIRPPQTQPEPRKQVKQTEEPESNQNQQ
jgi:hypothetical protein